ncbi:hypothetical protein AB0M54_08180 [Actinoplanes sp. NPDC051470]
MGLDQMSAVALLRRVEADPGWDRRFVRAALARVRQALRAAAPMAGAR